MILDLQQNPKYAVGEEYEVQKIMDERWQGNRIVYLVKWKGYPHSQNTWEPRENLTNAPGKLKEWKEKKLRLNLEFEREDSGQDYRQNRKRGSKSKFSSERRKTLKGKEVDQQEKMEKSQLEMLDIKLKNREKVWEKAQYQAQQSEDQIQPLLICTLAPKTHTQNQTIKTEPPNSVESLSIQIYPSPSDSLSQKSINNPLEENIQSFDSNMVKEEEVRIDEENKMVEEKQEQMESRFCASYEDLEVIQEGDRLFIEIEEEEEFQQVSNRCSEEAVQLYKQQQSESKQQNHHQSRQITSQEQRNDDCPLPNPSIDAKPSKQDDQFGDWNESNDLPSSLSNQIQNSLQIPILPSRDIPYITPFIDSIVSSYQCPQSNQIYLKIRLTNGYLTFINYATLYTAYPSTLLQILECSLLTSDRNN